VLGNAPKRDYSREEVRRVLDVSERRLRTWERQGLCSPSHLFSYSDLIALRALKQLYENRVPPGRIRRALDSLKRKLSDVESPLSELKILGDGRTITVLVAGQKMDAISGQMLLNFETAELATVKAFPKVQGNGRARLRQSEALFQQGLMLEETGAPVDQAISAYRRAVELNPAAAGALVNLGTIHYRRQEFQEAEKLYRNAIEVDGSYALAHFNLGNLYDELRKVEQARECYEQTLRLNPNYADAHFNLAVLFEKTDEYLKAVRHWKAYLKLDATSSWAEIARRQLDKLRMMTLISSR
jgi:tetratricopeptide (TPR) repeat protein